MSHTNKKTLERDIINAVHRYQLDARTSATKATQTAMEILGKYAPCPGSLLRMVAKRKRLQSWRERVCSALRKVRA